MRSLNQDDLEIDPFHAIKDDSRRQTANAWVMLNMVSSIDGATAIEGVSSPLSGSGDRKMFSAIRDICDVVIVGSSTTTAEQYRPEPPSEKRQMRRINSGGHDGPTIAVVSHSLDLDYSQELFSDPHHRPILLTTAESEPNKKREAARFATVIEAGQTVVDATTAVAALANLGLKVQLLEGGPILNGHFLNAEVIDEMFLTLSPKLIGGPTQRIIFNAGPTCLNMRLVSILEEEGELYLRYLRR